ncbi:MAG: slipin family protein [Candidatus Fermentithermobacillus carboniphilus]|uniref:Slipin family protein n=1 Tax=Candidatus Fermentithermobacillus carboniphilus TaxID=3085328 RepID=A0AAT9LC91_9FIRM|nr:MAG: slipin family protein [Candidatus Fermentithermobacillus carboniphilus]
MSALGTAGLVSVLVGGIFWLITTLIALSRKDTIAGVVHGALGFIILVLSIVFIDTVGLPLPIVLLVIELTSFRIISEYARGVIFRFGRMHGVLGPGVSVILPLGIDQVKVVDVRTFTIDVPRQEIITRDNVPVVVDAVVYFNIFDPVLAVTKVANYVASTSLLGQTILRSVLGQHELDDILAKRAELNETLRKLLDEATDPWGVKVTMVEIKSIELPDTMKRAMARQAEAERDRRAKVIAAEGELQASQRLAEAAQVMSSQPVALQLRYLQTLSEIAAEQNSTIVFPLPVELLKLIDRTKERD